MTKTMHGIVHGRSIELDDMEEVHQARKGGKP